MECKKHESDIVLHAFSEGKCEKCGINIVTSHIPCNKICKDCSEKHNLCEVCGLKLETK